MDRQLPKLAIADVVDVVNEYGSQPRIVAGEQMQVYPRLHALERLRPGKGALVEAADRLHPAFAARSAAPSVLNRLITELELRPHVDRNGVVGWATPRSRRTLLAACTATLVDWVTDHGLDRHGTCSASRCVDVFVDNSRPGTRRYCSEICLSRARVAAWRARRRAARIETGEQ